MLSELGAGHRLFERWNDEAGTISGRLDRGPGRDPRARQPREPIRLVHHFACTGGTLICKCIASMPNVQLLSEVDPLDPQAHADPQRFAPTDLVRLVRLGTAPVPPELLQEIFVAGLDPVRRKAERTGLRLVLRDHSHGQFCFGPLTDLPTLRETLQDHAELLSVVTVRHPVASFVSLRQNGWIHFEPGTLDEYAKRYEAFLARHADAPRIRYESLVADPKREMKRICAALDLPFRENFEQTLGAHRLSGDSGRQGLAIAPRAPRPVPDGLIDEARQSRRLGLLCEKLGYDDIDPGACAPARPEEPK